VISWKMKSATGSWPAPLDGAITLTPSPWAG
jgi:hypothetical protein